MKLSALLRSRVVCGLLAATLFVLTMSGCGGGWGSAKPTIATQSTGQSAGQGAQAQTVTAGQPATFSVTPAGTGPFTYQWYVNGVAINGAVSYSYTVAATTSGDNGSLYTVAVTNAAGTIVSAPFLLTVNTPPSLTVQPVSETVIAGQPATFSVTATGTAPISYQWYQGTTPISGATGPTYTTPATAVGNSGAAYTVVVTNPVGTINSPAATLTVTPLVPTLSFSPIAGQTYGEAPFAVSATSASSGAVSYSVGSGPATIVGNTVTLTGTGTVVLNASQVANGNYIAATATTSFTVGDEVPTITFPSPGTKTYGQQPFTVTATSNSPGAITYSVGSGPATIVGNTVTLTGTGKVVLNASQVASGNFAAATATTSFTVGGEVPTLSFTPIAAQTYGNGPILVTASSNSPGAITYSVVSGPATIVGNTVTLTGAAPSVELQASQVASGNFAAATATTSFTVNPGTPSLSFAVGPQNYGDTAPFAVSASSASSGAITYSVLSGPATISNVDVVTLTGAGTVVLQASQAATANYLAPPPVSATFVVTAVQPNITVQPISQNLCPNSVLTLSVAASNAISYQWYLGATLIQGATSSSYTVSGVTSANAGNYTVVVTNAAGTVTSNTATVVVGSSITTQPTSLSIYAYQTATFAVAATGISPFTYQWYQTVSGATTPISGATSSVYTTGALGTADTGTEYYATVADACTPATQLTSSTATVTVQAGTGTPPTITTQPVGQTVTAGGTVTFSAVAAGSPTMSYQWYRVPGGGSNPEITGTMPQAAQAVTSNGNTDTYTVPASDTTTANDQDQYYVEVTNSYGLAVSQSATLAVGNGVQLQLVGQPASVYVNPGAPATFSVTANSALPLTYQWWMVPAGQTAVADTIDTTSGTATTTASAVPILGATSSTYTIPATSTSQSGNVYYVVVSNGSTSAVYSNTASLFVGSLANIPSCSSGWNTIGDAQSFDSATCSYQLTAATTSQHGEIVWPTLISTGNIQLSFTIATNNASSPPADGFAMVLGDPSLGATLTSLGAVGQGLGAEGIPGFVLAFDDYYNAGIDPSTSANPDYLGVGRSETDLWENPYRNVNNNLADALADGGSSTKVSHNYVVTIVQGQMTVTMDGTQVFSGNISVSVPPVAYLYITSSTGNSYEQTVISNIQATVSAPSN